MPKIYTKTGDKGETGLITGTRVPKQHPLLEAYGGLDELSSQLGLVICSFGPLQDDLDLENRLRRIQHRLFVLGSLFACDSAEMRTKLPQLSPSAVSELEKSIDEMNKELPELKSFILPGGVELAAKLHVCRAVCRRVERQMSSVVQGQSDLAEALVYMNRLSDYLFVAARYINMKSGQPEITWDQSL